VRRSNAAIGISKIRAGDLGDLVDLVDQWLRARRVS